jgi:hypothetical protein
MNLGNYSKLYGSVSGGVLGYLIAALGLPAAFATPEMTAALTVILSGIFTFAFPANRP